MLSVLLTKRATCLFWGLVAFVPLVGAEEFDEATSKHFVDIKRTPDDVFVEAAKDDKPVMVLITQPWCGACNGMKKSVSGGTAVKELLPNFLTVHAVGEEGDEWKKRHGSTAGYVPQMYWFSSDGSPLDLPGPNDEYRHFFSSDSDLAAAMKKALVAKPCLVKTLENCHEKQTKYIETWKAKGQGEIAKQIEILKNKLTGQLKPEQSEWMNQRMAILKQFESAGKDEL